MQHKTKDVPSEIQKLLKHIWTETTNNGRVCWYGQEIINNIASGNPILATKDYIHRHASVGTYIHWKICQYYEIAREKVLYADAGKANENEKATIVWDMPIHRDREIKANGLDIEIRDGQEIRELSIELINQ